MTEPRYAVAFDGSVRPDSDPEQVKAQLTAALKLRPDHIEKLFSGQIITVKRNLLYAQALRLQAVFDEAGALCQLVREQDPPGIAAAPAQADAPELAAPQDGDASARLAAQQDGDASARLAVQPNGDASVRQAAQTAVEAPAAPMPPGHSQGQADGASIGSPPADQDAADIPTPAPAQADQAAAASAQAPAARASTPSPPLHLSPGDIPGLFTGKPRRMPPTTSHRFGLIGAALAALLMPLLYGSLILAVAYAMLWYAFKGLLFMNQPSLVGLLFGYFLPLALGVVVLIFLLKPLLARAVPPPQRVTLDPLREPVLFALVQHLADLVGAPYPERIHVDCSVNASVGFSHALPPLGGGGLELTIGMPLFAGLSTRQLIGVLGHEFGHLPQQTGMRAAFITRLVDYWFYRAIHGRDAWDVKLAALRQDRFKWLAVVFTAVAGAVSWQRKLLSGLYWLSQVISQPILRRMEVEADRCAAQLAGSEAVRGTAQRVLLLMRAFEDVSGDLASRGQDATLPEDLPGLIARRADELGPLQGGKLDSQVDQAHASLFAGHPPDADRIARAEQLSAPALFVLDTQATALLKKYDKLARQTTDAYYRGALGIAPARERPGTSPVVSAVVEQSRQLDAALKDYCRELFAPSRFIAPVDWHGFAALTPEQRRERLDALVVRLREAVSEVAEQLSRYGRLNEQVMLAYGDQVVREAGVPFEARAEEGRSLAQLKDERLGLDASLRRHEAVLGERMAIALGGLIQEAGEHAEIGREIVRLLAVQGQLAALAGTYEELGGALNVLMRLNELPAGQAADDGPASPHPDALFAARVGEVVEHLERVKGLLDKVSYPFSHVGGEISVFAQLKEGLPELHPKQRQSVLEYSRDLLNALSHLYRRVFGRLAQLAGGYERGMGVVALQNTQAATAPVSTPESVPAPDTVVSDEV